MSSRTVEFVSGIVEKAKNLLKEEPKDREDFIEETVNEMVKRFENGEVSPDEIHRWPDRLNVDETELVAELIYSQLVIKATMRAKRFEQALLEGGNTGPNSGYMGATTRITYAEESLTDYFLPKFVEMWREEAEESIKLFDRAAELASTQLDEKKKELALREKNKFKNQFEIVEEISELARSFEDEELRKEREEIYELDTGIRTSLESSSPGGMMEGFGGPRNVPQDEESEQNLKRRNKLLEKRAERTPEEVREKIHERYEKLKKKADNSEDIREDLNLLEKEELT